MRTRFVKAALAFSLLGLMGVQAVCAGEDVNFPGPFFTHESANFETLWLNAEVKAEIQSVFDYRLNRLRVRYWIRESSTAWILEEVGKEQPITFGIVVNDEKIQSIDVLAYRESRGGEIQHAFFRKQFIGATLRLGEEKQRLDRNIDGITGATLSVHAMKKVAKVAIFLHKHALSSQ